MTSTSVSVTHLFKDLYPRAGDRIKQWVIDSRRERAWDLETCPSVSLPPHKDNTDADCRNVPSAVWIDLAQHDCCHECNDVAEAMEVNEPAVVAWLAERARRPPICADRAALSDEIAEDYSLRGHPLLAFTRKP